MSARASAVWLLMLAAACSTDSTAAPWSPPAQVSDGGVADGAIVPVSGSDGGSPSVCDGTTVYSADFGSVFIREHCTTCHSSTLVGAARNGAPPTVNFDTTDEIAAHVSDIRTRVIVQRSMPPGAPVTDCVASLLSQYLHSFGSCTPDCSARQCGADGCGGSCGACGTDAYCEPVSGACITRACEPSCEGAACGSDGCGGSCGACASGLGCTAEHSCACTPNCDQRTCGDDGCGGSCGSCASGSVCDTQGVCLCIPTCTNKLCGDDGCGGHCGTCSAGTTCNSLGTVCQCIPNCQNRTCGSDGCGGSCGSCASALTCDTRVGQCVHNCRPDCTGRACGDDGCGGTCGSGCTTGQTCTSAGQCACTPSCEGRACGGDGCGGSCGSCASGTACNVDGQCGCSPSCAGRSCGDDGCGGNCGSCATPAVCSLGQCVTQCSPNCAAASCGSDGCGGTCGTCAAGQTCTKGSCVYSSVSFGTNVYPIFKAASCGKSACHAGSQPAENLDLSSASTAYAALVNIAASECSARLRVSPGQPSSSYLINKLTGVDMCSGSRMPKGGSALSTTDIDIVRSWIGSGVAP